MTITIDLTSLYDHLTGLERFALNISKYLIEQHPEHHYLLLFKNEVHPAFLSIINEGRAEAEILKQDNKLLMQQLTRLRALRKNRADVYFFPAFPAPWLFGKKGILNVIHDVSDYDCPAGKNSLKVLYCRMGISHAVRSSRSILTVSSFSLERISKRLGIDEDRFFIIYNGVTYRRADFSPADDRRILDKYHLPYRYYLCVSTLEPRKNLKLLLQAQKELAEEFPGWLPLVLAGRFGWNRKAALGNAEQSKDVYITGFIADEDLPVIYRNAEAFVFPSLYEGFGIPPLEAMEFGTPVISSDAAAMPEILGGAAAYFRNNDLDDLKRALREFASLTDAERDVMREKGYVRAARFCWDTESDKLAAVMERIVSERKDTSRE